MEERKLKKAAILEKKKEAVVDGKKHKDVTNFKKASAKVSNERKAQQALRDLELDKPHFTALCAECDVEYHYTNRQVASIVGKGSKFHPSKYCLECRLAKKKLLEDIQTSVIGGIIPDVNPWCVLSPPPEAPDPGEKQVPPPQSPEVGRVVGRLCKHPHYRGVLRSFENGLMARVIRQRHLVLFPDITSGPYQGPVFCPQLAGKPAYTLVSVASDEYEYVFDPTIKAYYRRDAHSGIPGFYKFNPKLGEHIFTPACLLWARVTQAGNYVECSDKSDVDLYHPGLISTQVQSSLGVRDLVVRARDNEFFHKSRTLWRKFMSKYTLHNLFDQDRLYVNDQTKCRRVVYHKSLLVELLADKVNLTIGVIQNKHLATPIMKYIHKIPYEIILDTLLVFNEHRTEFQAELKANAESQATYLSENRTPSRHVQPSTVQLFRDVVSEGADGPEVINLLHQEDALQAHREGKVLIPRVPYSSSAPELSTSLPSNEKFSLSDNSKGVSFSSPKLTFKTRDVGEKVDEYETIGCAFGTKMARVQFNTTEVENCVLRLTASRENEAQKHADQRAFFAPIVKQGIKKFPAEYRKLEQMVREKNPDCPWFDYSTILDTPLSSGQQAVLDYYNLRCAQPVNEEFQEHKLNPLKSTRDYIDYIGLKKEQRYEALADYEDDANAKTTKYTSGAQKRHEAQKYKIKDFNPLLSFARLFMSVVGVDYIKADPYMAFESKDMISTEFHHVDGHLRMGGVSERAEFESQLEFKYRSVLKETSLKELSIVITDIYNFVSGYPDRAYGISHGDDMLVFKWDLDRGVYVDEGDISKNDISHTEAALLPCFFELLERGYQPYELFVQVFKDILIVNPSNRGEKAILHNEYACTMPTGFPGTTYCNSWVSACLIINNLVQGGRLATTSLGLGYDLTNDEFMLEQATFLSKGFYRKGDNLVAYTELASILRSFGRTPGDFVGDKKDSIVARFYDHVLVVWLGLCHEPDSWHMRALGRLVRQEPPCSTEYHNLELEEALSKRYSINGCTATVLDEYFEFCKLLDGIDVLFGKFIIHPFVDRVMMKRYQCPPVIRASTFELSSTDL